LAVRDRFKLRAGAKLILDKRLPVAAGLGGGSADAAAALRLLDRWWRLEAEEAMLREIAAVLGADVPACLVSRPARGEDKGDQLIPIDAGGLAGTPVLLVNPGVPLTTAAVFQAWDGLDRGPLQDWREGRNDLEPAAIGLVPEIAEVLAALGGAELARMSGSGATCFGLYRGEAERDAAAAAIGAAHPQWWVASSHLR
jgi:4-diphosphocytidyl-2-C-methyl-D-erythritol kinase